MLINAYGIKAPGMIKPKCIMRKVCYMYLHSGKYKMKFFIPEVVYTRIDPLKKRLISLVHSSPTQNYFSLYLTALEFYLKALSRGQAFILRTRILPKSVFFFINFDSQIPLIFEMTWQWWWRWWWWW